MMRILFTFAFLLPAAVVAVKADDDLPAEQVRFFEADIRPLLVANCHKCHGPKEQKGKLRLDSLSAATAGVDTPGKVV